MFLNVSVTKNRFTFVRKKSVLLFITDTVKGKPATIPKLRDKTVIHMIREDQKSEKNFKERVTNCRGQKVNFILKVSEQSHKNKIETRVCM